MTKIYEAMAEIKLTTENIQKVIKMFPRDNDWKKLITKNRRDIDALRRGKDLPQKVEDELVQWALDNNEIKTDDVDELDAFIYSIMNEGTVRNALTEARGFDLEFQVKGCKNLKAFEAQQARDDYETTLIGLQASYFDLYAEGTTQKISGDKILLSFTAENLEDAGTTMKEQLQVSKEFCKNYTKFAKDTSKAIQKEIADGQSVKDIYPNELATNNPIDVYYGEAVRVGQADPKRPFVYSVRLK
jgi:hypothetical protein